MQWTRYDDLQQQRKHQQQQQPGQRCVQSGQTQRRTDPTAEVHDRLPGQHAAAGRQGPQDQRGVQGDGQDLCQQHGRDHRDPEGWKQRC